MSCSNDCIHNKNHGHRKGKRNNGNMDLLHKFRYNFHYWLKNAYQAGDSEHVREVPMGNISNNSKERESHQSK